MCNATGLEGTVKGQGVMSRFSISARLVFLATVLLAVLFVSNYLLSRELARNARALAEDAEIVEALRKADQATSAFGDLKYWLTDLAVSLLMISERQMFAARDRLAVALAALERYDAKHVAAIRAEADALVTQGMEAVNAYTDDQRVLGNSMMATARQHIAKVDQQLAVISDRLQTQALQSRDIALDNAARALTLSKIIVIGATVAGLLLTLLVLYSITAPLRRLVASMSEITKGNLDAVIPAPTSDEIGVMAQTLRLFRDNLVERAGLEAERKRAEAAVRAAQERLSDAVESISEGFSLYDTEDRLVLCNSRYREMLYPGMEDAVVPGTTFGQIIRAAAESGLLKDAIGKEDDWIKNRLALHRAPGEAHVHQRGDGRWVRVAERKTSDGGTVAVYTDITDDKNAEQKLRKAKEQAEQTLNELKQTQQSLIHSEKMASLGQLTAGIAHEIKNPLNFVINFSMLSVQLIAELRSELDALLVGVADETRDEVRELLETISGNLQRIEEHGARADGIVKSMLSHVREGPAALQATDLNALIEESLNLAYHGARAESQDFNITLEREFDSHMGEVRLYPQEMTRVFLNLIGNAFYATRTRQAESNETEYRPTLWVSTKDLGQAVEVRFRDNGTGMPEEVAKEIFNPFFTTKPVGEGTGLGLSMSYDIVVKEHRGKLDVRSEEGEFTEFVLKLPRLNV